MPEKTSSAMALNPTNPSDSFALASSSDHVNPQAFRWWDRCELSTENELEQKRWLEAFSSVLGSVQASI